MSFACLCCIPETGGLFPGSLRTSKYHLYVSVRFKFLSIWEPAELVKLKVGGAGVEKPSLFLSENWSTHRSPYVTSQGFRFKHDHSTTQFICISSELEDRPQR